MATEKQQAEWAAETERVEVLGKDLTEEQINEAIETGVLPDGTVL